MTKEQIKEILIRTFICFNYSLLLLPWASEIFAPSLGAMWMVKLLICWFFIALISQLLSLSFNRNSTLSKPHTNARAELFLAILLTIIGILGSLIVPYILMPNLGDRFLLDSALSVITFTLWVIYIYLSGVSSLRNLINTRLLSYGLVVISVYSLSFRSSRAFIISLLCFIAYIFLSALLFVFTFKKNVKMVSFGISSVIILGFIIGGIKGWIGMTIGWIYKNIIAKFILFLFTLASYFLNGKTFAPDTIKDNVVKDPSEVSQTVDNLQTIKPNASAKSLFSIIAGIMKVILPLIMLFLICYVLFKIIYKLIKHFNLKEIDITTVETTDELKEFVRPEIHITDFATRSGKLTKKIQRAIYGPSFEDRIKKMLKNILLKMQMNLFPLKPSYTPNEIKEIITQGDEALFNEYNRIKYGNKTLTKEEFIIAEESYERLKTLISYNYITNKIA